MPNVVEKYWMRFAAAIATYLVWLSFSDWEIATGLLLGVFVHELGHMMAARLCKIDCEPMWIHPLGGFVKIEMEKARDIQKFVIALGGPLFGLFSVGAVFVLWYVTSDDKFLNVAFLLSLLNLINLLPAAPLDGGHAFRAVIQPFIKKTFIAVGIANFICAAIFLSTGKSFDGWMMLIFGVFATLNEFRLWKLHKTEPLRWISQVAGRRMDRSAARVGLIIYVGLFVTLAVLTSFLYAHFSLNPLG